MGFIQIGLTLIVSYALAAMLSSHVFMDLSLTHWASIWVYFWWVVSMPVTFGLFAVLAFSLAIAVVFFKNL